MIEQHTPSLATCQKLKEAGFPQETDFSWIDQFNGSKVDWSLFDTEVIICSAPILTEILEQLPEETMIGRELLDGYSSYGGYQATCQTWDDDGIETIHQTVDANPAQAAALLWLELNGGK